MTTEQAKATPIQFARQLLQEKKIPEGISYLRKYLASAPEDRAAQELLGMGLFMAKKYTDARAAFEQLTRLDPMYSPGWVNLGAVLNILKEHQAATKALRKGIQRDTKSASAYYNLGIAQRALKMNSTAISAYQEAIKLKPEMAEAYVNLGNLYIEMTNYTQAIRVLDSGMALCPGSKKLKVVSRKAKQLKEGNRRNVSPFGRLVDEAELAKKQIRTTKRDLTPAERNEERDFLKAQTKTMRKLNVPMVALLDDPLHHQLHFLSLAVAQNDTRGEAPDAYDEMTATLEELDQIRAETRKSILEIRSHLERTDPGL